MMRYFLGVDSGGTKAAYVLAQEDGQIVDLRIGKGYARPRESTDQTVAEIALNIETLLAISNVAHTDVVGMGFGLPFFGELAQKDSEITEALKERYSDAVVYVTNDSEVAWMGSLAGQIGVNIVAGTGSIAFGRNEAGQVARAGGWAPFFSDEGSCFWLGRNTMELFSKQADRRIERGALYDIIREEFYLGDDLEFVEQMERDIIPYRDRVARIQELTERAAAAGDPAVRALYTHSVDELILAIETVARVLGLDGTPFLVSYSGGLFKTSNQIDPDIKQELVIDPFRKKAEALGAIVSEPLLEPYQGAVLCAIREAAPKLLDRATMRMIAHSEQDGDTPT
ncbi:MAG: ATPase [Actinomycetia bacterium]|nr:ATPase [Actinomycetes bacterium]